MVVRTVMAVRPVGTLNTEHILSMSELYGV